MEWPDDLAAELPGPNPDEPQSLREDILDELRDHLQSSMELEQLRGTPVGEAEEAVISRFGNPVQMARQLWWDAMKGRIMSQRITLALVILLCLLSIAATAMIWLSVQQGHETTAALIAKLDDIANRPAPVAAVPAPVSTPEYFDWVPVTVVLKDEQGNPVSGDDWRVSINGELYRDGERSSHRAHPNEEGVCDLGPVRLGRMTFNVEGSKFSMYDTHSVRPGKPFQREIIVPVGDRETVEQSLVVNWPEEIKHESLWTHLVLSYKPIKLGEETWSWGARELPTTYYTASYLSRLESGTPEPYRGPDSLPEGMSVLISPEGKLFVGELQPEELYLMSRKSKSPTGREQEYYSKIFSQFFFQRYQHNYLSPSNRYRRGRGGDNADKVQPEILPASFLELFPLVQFHESEAGSRTPGGGTLTLPTAGFSVSLMSVISPVSTSEISDTVGDFEGRVVSVSSRELNYAGVGGDSRGDGGGVAFAYAPRVSPLDAMLFFDEDHNVWEFVPSKEIVEQVQKNISELHRSLEARGNEASGESKEPSTDESSKEIDANR